jgi:hypothetical protein
MTFRISQLGKEYLKTAETLLPPARTMTDRAIARQLETLADDYSGGLRKLHMLMRPKRWLARHLAPNVSSRQDLIGGSK